MAIQRHFPDFNVAEFAGWLERSFLPHLLSSWIAGQASRLRDVAEANVIQERQLQVSEYVSSGLIIHSRILSVYNVEVMDFDFKGHRPTISVSCMVDHTEDVRSRGGNQRIGGPEEIFASEFLVAVTVAEVGNEPVWKANELRAGNPRTRI
jgi:predicted lipid-binding transport protein (Tim44 family)